MTSDLKKRIWEHKNFIHPESFTAKYKLTILVYYEGFHRIEEAIEREKLLKGGSRKQKEDLINSVNLEWKDLHAEVEAWQFGYFSPLRREIASCLAMTF